MYKFKYRLASNTYKQMPNFIYVLAKDILEARKLAEKLVKEIAIKVNHPEWERLTETMDIDEVEAQ